MPRRFIASVYPITMHAERGIYGGVFHLPAFQKDGRPVMYEVRDHVQTDTLPWIMAPQGAQRQSQIKILINATDITRDIIQEWTLRTLGQSPDCRPGIWMVRDQIPLFEDDGITPMKDALGQQEWRQATKEEREEMFQEDLAYNLDVQSRWADYCIMQGDIMGENIKAVQFIPSYCKVLCRYYGRDRKWLHNLKDGDIKTCSYCKKTIPSDAVKCQFCQEVVDWKAYNKLKAEGQEVIPSQLGGNLSVEPNKVRERIGLPPIQAPPPQLKFKTPVTPPPVTLDSTESSDEAPFDPESQELGDVSDVISDGEDWQKELAAITESESGEPVRRGPGRPRKQ